MINIRSIVIVTATTLTVSAVASAGKPERDRQKELTPQVNEAKASLKKACGCAVGINVDWDSYKKADDMFQVPNALSDIVSVSTAHCTDDAEKKALCSNLKSYDLVFNDSGTIKLEGKKLTCGTASSTRCGDNQIKAILDKF